MRRCKGRLSSGSLHNQFWRPRCLGRATGRYGAACPRPYGVLTAGRGGQVAAVKARHGDALRARKAVAEVRLGLLSLCTAADPLHTRSRGHPCIRCLVTN